MIKAIMALDDEGGVSKEGSMPWPINLSDLKWFKKHTLNNVVIMGKLTWIDPFIPTPLKNRVNVLITSQDKTKYPGADEYISDDLIKNVKFLSKKPKKISKIRKSSRTMVKRNFNSNLMSNKYIKLYRTILKAESSNDQ